MKDMRCEVFPDLGIDILAGLEGEQRLAALRRVFENLEQFLMSDEGLAAVRRISCFGGLPSNGSQLSVDPEKVWMKTGIQGVSKITVIHASNGRALTVASVQDMHSPPVHPILTVVFETYAEWPEGSGQLPFFKSLAAALGNGVQLVFGYSCPYDQSAGA